MKKINSLIAVTLLLAAFVINFAGCTDEKTVSAAPSSVSEASAAETEAEIAGDAAEVQSLGDENESGGAYETESAEQKIEGKKAVDIALQDAGYYEYKDFSKIDGSVGVADDDTGFYEVTFKTETTEFEYHIDTVTGEILSKEVRPAT